MSVYVLPSRPAAAELDFAETIDALLSLKGQPICVDILDVDDGRDVADLSGVLAGAHALDDDPLDELVVELHAADGRPLSVGGLVLRRAAFRGAGWAEVEVRDGTRDWRLVDDGRPPEMVLIVLEHRRALRIAAL